MKSRLLVINSYLVCLGMGFLLGFLIFHDRGSSTLIIPAKAPVAGEPPSPQPLQPRDDSLEQQVRALKAENERLAGHLKASVEKLREAQKMAGGVERIERSQGNPDAGGNPARLPDRPSRAGPGDLKDGTGGLEGYFIEADGSPGAGVSVKIEKESGDTVTYMTNSDASGYFRKLDLAPGSYSVGQHTETETSHRWAIRSARVKAGIVSRVDFEGTNCISVEGRALDSRSKPLSNCQLWLLTNPDDSWPESSRAYQLYTDAEGWFRIENLKPGEYQWILSRGKLETFKSFGSGKVSFTENGPFEWNITAGSNRISGIVIDRDSGAPLAGAHVIARSSEDPTSIPSGAPVTDSSGEFRIDGVTQGKYELNVFCDGHVEQICKDIEVLEGQSVESLRIVMDRAGIFMVKVLDGNGAPIKDSEVYIEAVDEKGKKREQHLHFKSEGIAEVDSFPPGLYRIEITALGYKHALRSGVLISLGNGNPMLEFSLEKK